MSETLAGVASALRQTGGTFGELGARLAVVDCGAHQFGAGGPGAVGELGQLLYGQWQRALDARVREAREHGNLIEELGDTVSRASSGYSEIDDSADRRARDAS